MRLFDRGKNPVGQGRQLVDLGAAGIPDGIQDGGCTSDLRIATLGQGNRCAGSSWKMGDDFTGDPPSEAQGANSIFDTDISTLEVLRRHATALGQL